MFAKPFRCWLIALFTLSCFYQLNAQPPDRPGKVFFYKAIVKTVDGKKIKAWLYDADEEQLYFVANSVKIKSAKELRHSFSLPSDQVLELKLRRKGSYWRTAMWGGIIGFTGTTIGMLIDNSGRDDDKLDPLVIIGTGLWIGLNSALIGSLFGGIPAKKFKFGNKHLPYQAQLDLIQTYTIQAQME